MSDPYYSESDELGILGCCIRGTLANVSDIAASIRPATLFNDDVRDSYELVLALLAENSKPSLPAMERLWAQTQGIRPIPRDLWKNAMAAVPSASNHPFYAQGVFDAYRRRALRDAAQRLLHDSGDAAKSPEAMVADLEAGISNEGNQAVISCDGKTVVREFIDDLQKRAERKGKLSGIPTGFWKLDAMTDGLQFGELFLCGARPSIGKTAIAMNIVRHACIEQGWPTLVVSCEMSQKALMRRLMSDLSQVPLGDMKRGDFTEAQWKAQTLAGSRVGNSKIHFLDASKGETIDTIVAGIRSNVRRHGVKLVVVDYLQKIRPSAKHEKRTYEVADVSEKLKSVSASTGVAMLCLAQLSRQNEKEKGRVPRLTDLADSAQIERDADVVTLLHRDRQDKNGEALLVVAKQRDGECGFVPLTYNEQFCRFETRAVNVED